MSSKISIQNAGDNKSKTYVNPANTKNVKAKELGT